MIGLFMLVAFLCIMGFVLAFIHNMFSEDELAIGKAIVMLFLTGVVGFVIKAALSGEAEPAEVALARAGVEFLTLAGLLRVMAYVPMKKALLIALVYAVVSFLFGMFIVYMLSPS